MFHFQQKCPEEIVVSWKRWSEKVLCGAHRHTEAANEKENWNYCAVFYRTERPSWRTVRQHLRFHVALEPGIQLQFSSCGSLRRNGIGWASANAGDVLRRRPCRELLLFSMKLFVLRLFSSRVRFTFGSGETYDRRLPSDILRSRQRE